MHTYIHIHTLHICACTSYVYDSDMYKFYYYVGGSNLSIIIGATIGGIIALILLISVLFVIICCFQRQGGQCAYKCVLHTYRIVQNVIGKIMTGLVILSINSPKFCICKINIINVIELLFGLPIVTFPCQMYC